MRRRFKSAVCGALAGAFLLAQAGAGAVLAQDFVPQEVDLQDVKRIAILTYSFSSEYWGYVQQGCTAYDAADTTVSIEVEGVSSSIAVDEQITMLKAELGSGKYDGYVIAAINEKMVEDVLKNETVPVVAINTPLEVPCVIGGIGTDNEVAAAAGAKKAVDMAKETGLEKPQCVMIGGFEDEYNNENRVRGFRRGIEENGGIWMDKVYATDKSAEGAREAMDQIMKDYPDGISIIVCYNDLLASSALEEAIENPAFADTVFLGFDGNGSICDRIMNDERYAKMVTVAQNSYEMGFHAVEMLSQYFHAQEEADVVKESSAEAIQAGANQDGGNQAEANQPETEESNWKDSGYAVITKINVQERMIQIQSHLS